jgi:hypothetical protein
MRRPAYFIANGRFTFSSQQQMAMVSFITGSLIACQTTSSALTLAG